jgi:hypothetical protein
MPTVSTVLSQCRFFRHSIDRHSIDRHSIDRHSIDRHSIERNRIKNGVFRFYYSHMSAPLRSAKAARLNDLDGTRGASARVANAFAAPDAGGADVVWTMMPTACGKWRHVVNTKIIKRLASRREAAAVCGSVRKRAEARKRGEKQT